MLYGVRAIPVPDVEELRIIGHRFRNVRNEDADLVDVWKFHVAKAANVRLLHGGLLSYSKLTAVFIARWAPLFTLTSINSRYLPSGNLWVTMSSTCIFLEEIKSSAIS